MPASLTITGARLVEQLNPAPWVRDAVCELSDYRNLDPILGSIPSRTEIAERRQFAEHRCAHCPVLVRCGAKADVHQEPGVWGGALRYVDSRLGGEYVALPLIPVYAHTRHNIRTVRQRRERRAAAALPEKS